MEVSRRFSVYSGLERPMKRSVRSASGRGVILRPVKAGPLRDFLISVCNRLQLRVDLWTGLWQYFNRLGTLVFFLVCKFSFLLGTVPRTSVPGGR